jgi:hypothetical protein
MPNGHLDIGIGYGGATVFNNDPAVQNFAKVINDRNVKRQQEMKDLSDEFSKASPIGIREPDRDVYNKKYMDLQAIGRQKINERDPYKKAMLQAQIDRGFQDLAEHVSNSKSAAANEKFSAQFLADDRHRKQFTDDAVQKLIKSRSLPIDHPDYVKDLNSLQRNPDMADFDKKLKEMHSTLMSGAKWNTGSDGKYVQPEKDPFTGDLIYKKSVDPNIYRKSLLHYYDLDPDAPAIFRKMYPDLYNKAQSEGQFKAAAVNQFANDNPIEAETKPAKDPNQITRYEQEELKNRRETLNLGWYNATHKAGDQPNATAIIAENMRNSDPAKFVPLLKNTIPKRGWARGEDIKASEGVDENGQPIHIFKFPDKLTKDTKAVAHNAQIEANYNKNPQKEHWYGGKVIPYKESKYYKNQVAKNNILPETKVSKDNSAPYKIPTSDPQAYAIGVADMLREQGASDAEINHILGRTGVHPVKLGEKPTGSKKKKDSLGILD